MLLAIGAILSTIPFLWMVSTSLKNMEEVYRFPPTFIPETVMWRNYIEAFRRVPFGRFFLNSGYISLSVVVGQLFTCSLAGYAFARLRFPGRDALFLGYLGTMMIPFAVLMIPLFITMRYIGWVNTHYALIFPSLATAFGTFLMRQFMLTLPPRTGRRCAHRRLQLVPPLLAHYPAPHQAGPGDAGHLDLHERVE